MKMELEQVSKRDGQPMRFRASDRFANIMVEFETNDREMAVDVPDSFVGRIKTPPKFPPPSTSSSTLPAAAFASPTARESARIEAYSRDMVRTHMEKERRLRTEDFLRTSLRNSHKMAELASSSVVSRTKGVDEESVEGVVNGGFDEESNLDVLESLRALEDNEQARRLVEQPDFLAALYVFDKLRPSPSSSSRSRRTQPSTDWSECRALLEECFAALQPLPASSELAPLTHELFTLLSKPSMEGLLYCHDKIGLRRRMAHLTFDGPYLNNDAVVNDANGDESQVQQRLSQYVEPNIKIVRIAKTQEPLGATVRNEDEAVVVGRIIRGGSAEASGLLHEGDELLEINEVPMRGKNVNEVCDILANMTGVLTMLVIPAKEPWTNSNSGSSVTSSANVGVLEKRPPVMHVKAHFDYDPEDDPYLPCRELGISFVKGNVLHVINQRDPNWWQARREGEDDSQLPGLIPSAAFQAQREAIKASVALEAHNTMPSMGKNSRQRKSTSTLLCGGKRGTSGNKRSRNKSGAPNLFDNDNAQLMEHSNEFPTYEEVALYYPRSEVKRPVVLIGPPNIGRHELRQRLMQDQDRFAAAIPHTSRSRRGDELDGKDYHFISRMQFEQDILGRKFVEHGEYEKSYYGTSLQAIRDVVASEKICVLNLHPQSLKILKGSDLMPFIVFVSPPSMEKLRRWKIDRGEPVVEFELKEIIERAREMEENFGHFFDLVLVYANPDAAYHELLRTINALEQEPQWVPAAWLHRSSGSL